jgi:hypothetical protein
VQFGIEKVKSLFAAFNSGNEASVATLIAEPRPGIDGLEMIPSLRSALDKGVIDESTDIQVHSRVDLDAFMRDIAGIRFQLQQPLQGNVGTGLNTLAPASLAVAIGPVLWQATGEVISQHHHSQIRGGGKTLIDCASGKFLRAGFSPLELS